MADGNINVSINVNALLQKELARVIQKIYDEYGIMVTEINVDWVRMQEGISRITYCEVKTSFMP